MNFSLLYRRIKNIIVNPRGMWADVAEENREVNELRLSFLLPMVLLIAVSGVAGTLLFTYNGLALTFPLLVAIKYFTGIFLTVEVAARIVTEIAFVFTRERNFNYNYKLVLYSFTPFMASMIITRLFSSLLFLNLAGLYGIYIAYIGVSTLYHLNPQGKIRYTALISLTTLVFYLAVTFIINSVVDLLYFSIT